MKYLRAFTSAFLTCSLLILACSFLLITSAHALEGELLEKVYKLDAEMTAGVCPKEFKRVRVISTEAFGCDRVRIDYGYRSKELVQCRLRKNLANEIIREYNLFIDNCKRKAQE